MTEEQKDLWEQFLAQQQAQSEVGDEVEDSDVYIPMAEETEE